MMFSMTVNIFSGLQKLFNNFNPEELILIGLLIMIGGIRILIYANNESEKR